MATTEGESIMGLRKSVQSLMLWHETTRLLIRDLEQRNLALVQRVYTLEKLIEKEKV
jgi:hypothetical protein